jgi:fused signal recognition particle receptor
MSFLDKLKIGLGKTKNSLNDKMNDVFSNFRKVDDNLLEELEEILIMSDIGVETSTKIISSLRNRIKKENIKDEQCVKEALKDEMIKILDVENTELKLDTKPSVILVVGVNGVRKNNINRKDSK